MTDYRGIILFAETQGGKVDKKSLLALERARDLASELGVYMDVVLAGSDREQPAKELIAHGAKKVFIARNERFDMYDTNAILSLLAAIVKARSPEAVIFADSFAAKDLGPRLAQRFLTSFVPACTGLGVEDRERKIVQTRGAFGGRVTIRLLTTVNAPQVFSIRVDVSAEPCEAEHARGEIVEWTEMSDG